MQKIFHFEITRTTFNASILQQLNTTVCIVYHFKDIFSSFYIRKILELILPIYHLLHIQ